MPLNISCNDLITGSQQISPWGKESFVQGRIERPLQEAGGGVRVEDDDEESDHKAEETEDNNSFVNTRFGWTNSGTFQVSISQTFFQQLFRTKVFCLVFL